MIAKILSAVAVSCLFTNIAIAETKTVTAEIWGDNWFEVYVNGEVVIKDSVSITTERSFNSETATFKIELPAQISIIAKDFIENDTGLEYIGSRRQQMGDGGFIAQIKDQDGNVLAATNSSTQCLVTHHAPIQASCADENDPIAGQGACGFKKTDVPENWMALDFDDSNWPNATEYSEADVSPKRDYDKIDWDEQAKLIWSASLTQDNTLLCRLKTN